jgi:hypothetical protein
MIAGGDQDVVLSLTCRLLGSGEVSDRIRIYVNHQEIAVIQAASDWNNFSIVVPKAKLLKGSNGILLNWPIRTINTNLELERAVSRLERCLIPDSLPAYGEIYSFTMAVLPSHSQQHIVESLIYKAE